MTWQLLPSLKLPHLHCIVSAPCADASQRNPAYGQQRQADLILYIRIQEVTGASKPTVRVSRPTGLSRKILCKDGSAFPIDLNIGVNSIVPSVPKKWHCVPRCALVKLQLYTTKDPSTAIQKPTAYIRTSRHLSSMQFTGRIRRSGNPKSMTWFCRSPDATAKSPASLCHNPETTPGKVTPRFPGTPGSGTQNLSQSNYRSQFIRTYSSPIKKPSPPAA